MAYLGSTQLSSIANPPVALIGGMGAGADVRIASGSTLYISNNYGTTAGGYNHGKGFGQQLWMYHTTDMTSAPWNTAYFTDGGQIGMRPGDVIMMVRQGTTVNTSQYLTFACVASVTTAGAAALSTQSIITSS